MAALVDKGVWTPAQGLAYARQVQYPGDRAKALGELAGHLPKILLSEALDIARAISDESPRAEALNALAAHLPENLLQEALDTARGIPDKETARGIPDKENRAEALIALAARLPEIVPIALDTARAIQSEYRRAEALGDLAAHLPENLLPIALDTALGDFIWPSKSPQWSSNPLPRTHTRSTRYCA